MEGRRISMTFELWMHHPMGDYYFVDGYDLNQKVHHFYDIDGFRICFVNRDIFKYAYTAGITVVEANHELAAAWKFHENFKDKMPKYELVPKGRNV